MQHNALPLSSSFASAAAFDDDDSSDQSDASDSEAYTDDSA